MTTDKPINLPRLKELDAAATKGPWTTKPEPGDMSGDKDVFTFGMSPSVTVAATAAGRSNRVYATPEGGTFPAADQNFIAASRTELPRLVAWASDIITVIKRDVARRRANGEHMEELDEYEELLKEIEV